MTLALVAASLGALAMCLGLMRWPSVHWALADAFAQSGADAKLSLSAVFLGLNLYFGNYIGEFLGEACLAVFFFLAGMSFIDEARFPKWLGWGGMLFASLFLIGAFRNVLPAVQRIADVNNVLLPLWMVVLGGSLIWQSRKACDD
jgi:MFS superfamily sulfate permease-like transporter